MLTLRNTIRRLLLSPDPPLFAIIWPAIAVFLYLSFLGDAGYLTYRARKAQLEHLQNTLSDLKQEYRNLNDRFLYAHQEQSTNNTEQIILFKFENLPSQPATSPDTLSTTEKNRLLFFFVAIFIELITIFAYFHRRKTIP